ncbi:MAG: hypothetical protein GY769_07920 [bacterium]|nr:hypothetical protein [bacterium]
MRMLTLPPSEKGGHDHVMELGDETNTVVVNRWDEKEGPVEERHDWDKLAEVFVLGERRCMSEQEWADHLREVRLRRQKNEIPSKEPLTMEKLRDIAATFAELEPRMPKYGIWFSMFAEDDAYVMRTPGWVVVLIPDGWRERWNEVPEPRIPELTREEFNCFLGQWERSVRNHFLNDPAAPEPL